MESKYYKEPPKNPYIFNKNNYYQRRYCSMMGLKGKNKHIINGFFILIYAFLFIILFYILFPFDIIKLNNFYVWFYSLILDIVIVFSLYWYYKTNRYNLDDLSIYSHEGQFNILSYIIGIFLLCNVTIRFINALDFFAAKNYYKQKIIKYGEGIRKEKRRTSTYESTYYYIEVADNSKIEGKRKIIITKEDFERVRNEVCYYITISKPGLLGFEHYYFKPFVGSKTSK